MTLYSGLDVSNTEHARLRGGRARGGPVARGLRD